VTIATPVAAPVFAQSLGLQMSVLARDGVQHAELHLNPADMGPVSVQIVMDGTQARVDFGADVAATRHAIEAGLPELASALRDAGFTLAGGGVPLCFGAMAKLVVDAVRPSETGIASGLNTRNSNSPASSTRNIDRKYNSRRNAASPRKIRLTGKRIRCRGVMRYQWFCSQFTLGSHLLLVLRGEGDVPIPGAPCRLHHVYHGLMCGFGVGINDDGGVGLSACSRFQGGSQRVYAGIRQPLVVDGVVFRGIHGNKDLIVLCIQGLSACLRQIDLQF